MSSRLVNVYCYTVPNKKYLYARCDDAVTMKPVISAGLDYIVQACIDRGYVMLNAQDVLHYLVVNNRIKD